MHELRRFLSPEILRANTLPHEVCTNGIRLYSTDGAIMAR